MPINLPIVNTLVYGYTMADHITKSDWLDQGLKTLSENGANALKVGAMATRLNVSRGSFYWHFRDITDFRSQLLDLLKDRTTDQIIREIDAGPAPVDRLKYLLERAFIVRPTLDRALRIWGAHDAAVAAMVATADSEKIDYIARVLVDSGVEKQQAIDRAAFLFWAYLGQAMTFEPRHVSLSKAAIDDLSFIFQR